MDYIDWGFKIFITTLGIFLSILLLIAVITLFYDLPGVLKAFTLFPLGVLIATIFFFIGAIKE